MTPAQKALARTLAERINMLADQGRDSETNGLREEYRKLTQGVQS